MHELLIASENQYELAPTHQHIGFINIDVVIFVNYGVKFPGKYMKTSFELVRKQNVFSWIFSVSLRSDPDAITSTSQD